MIVHANVFGEGTPFVILHGFLGMGDNWKTMGKKIADKGYEVHLVDQRNHGRSFHSDDFSYELMVSDLKEYYQHKSLDTSILLGHSMGGKTAMAFATTYPEKISQLIVADIAPKYYPLHHQDILDGLQALDFTHLSSRAEVDQTLKNYIPDMGVRMFLMKNLYWRAKGQLGLRLNLGSLVKNVSEIGVPLDPDKRYYGETLFLKGQKSNYILKEDHTSIQSQFPNSKLVEIADAGHWLHAENPEDFLKDVLDFVKYPT